MVQLIMQQGPFYSIRQQSLRAVPAPPNSRQTHSPLMSIELKQQKRTCAQGIKA